MKLLKTIILCTLLFSSFKLNAQTFFGLQNSNYNGVHAIYTNPANLATMPFKRNANFSSFGFNIDNNYLSLETPFTFWQLISNDVPAQYQKDGHVDWQKSWLKENQGASSLWANVGLEYRGPSYATKYGERLVWATATRTRTFVSLENVTPELITWAKNLLDTQSVANLADIATKPFKFKANAFQEFSGSLSYRVINRNDLKVSLGTTGKLLLGLGAINMENKGSQIQTYSIDSIRLNYANIQMQYTSFNILSQLMKGILVGSLPNLNNIQGVGYGIDFGFSIESGDVTHKESNSKLVENKNYKWKLSGAILDFGKIGYSGSAKSFSVVTNTPVSMNLKTPEFIAAAAQGSSAMFDYTVQYAKDKGIYNDAPQQISVELPTTLQIQFDYSILPKLNVAMHWQQRLSNQSFGQSGLVFVPRFEHRWFEVSVPVSVYNNYEQFGLGAFTRIGPVFLGTDNFLKSFSTSKYSGINLYFGISSLLP